MTLFIRDPSRVSEWFLIPPKSKTQVFEVSLVNLRYECSRLRCVQFLPMKYNENYAYENESLEMAQPSSLIR